MRDQSRTPDSRVPGAPDRKPAVDAASRPDRPDGPTTEPRDHQDKGGIVEMLLREGPDAPDAADIEDPERQR
jgi:hypothetical protein